MKGLYTRLVSSVLFPLHEQLKRHDSVAVKKRLEISQWNTAEDLRTQQIADLRSFLCDIAVHVPYYRELFSELGFNPASLASLEDLQQIPLLDKATIRANTEELHASNATSLARLNTGGSSGEPLIFYIGKQRVSHDVAAKWRATRWWGVDIGDPELVVWGSPIELGAQDRVRQLRDLMLRTSLLPAFEMSPENLDRFVAEISRVKPKMLFGYPSCLSVIAEHARKTGRAMDKLGIKVVFVTSERLYDYQRESIESVFGCPVANGYGGRDAGFIAHQCPAGSMHLSAEDIVVEIVDREGRVLPTGQAGEIIVTHLATRDFPFVRYRTGDIGSLSGEPCSCGRGLQVLGDLQGRTTDFVVSSDGAMVHGLALIYILRDLPGIASFKVTQHSLTRTEVEIVKDEDYDAGNEEAIRAVFLARLGQQVAIDFTYRDSIDREKSGKYRYIISKVSI